MLIEHKFIRTIFIEMRLFFTAEVVAIDMGAISKRGHGGARMQIQAAV